MMEVPFKQIAISYLYNNFIPATFVHLLNIDVVIKNNNKRKLCDIN